MPEVSLGLDLKDNVLPTRTEIASPSYLMTFSQKTIEN